MAVSGFLFKRRFIHRFNLIKELSGMIVDFVTALYIVVPAVIIFLSFYHDLLTALPSWFLPEFRPLLPLVIAILLSKERIRSYLSRADLVLIFHHSFEFKKLLIYGQTTSIVFQMLKTVLLLVLIYPFFLHMDQVELIKYLIVILWVLLLNIAILLINWCLSLHLPSWAVFIIRPLIMILFLFSWSISVSSFMHSAANSWLWLILTAGLWIIASIIVIRLLKVPDWNKVVSSEESLDIDMMRIFLGHSAQAQISGGRQKKAILLRGHLGAGFSSERALSYFFLKYLMRRKKSWSEFGKFYLLAVLFLLTVIPFWLKLLMVTATATALGLLLEMIWREHSQDLFLRMLPLKWTEARQGISRSFSLLLMPFPIICLAGLIVVFDSWSQVAGVLGLLLVVILILPAYFSLKVLSAFDYK